MIIRNHYKILGVEYDATEQEIKEAYRILAKKYHPDLNQGDDKAAEKFKNVQEAHNTLIDEGLRYSHDVLLESKGIDTGRLKRRQEAAASAKQAREQEKQESSTATKDKPMTKAERNAAAMKKVNERKRFNRIIAIVLIVVVGAGALGGLFGGLAAAGLFLPRFTVEFNTGVPGQYISSERVRQGNSIVQPPNPTRDDDYTFAGWFTIPNPDDTSTAFAFGSPIYRNLTLYARWIAPPPQTNYVRIIRMRNWFEQDDTVIGEQEFVQFSRVVTSALAIPPANFSKPGYRFTGWYVSPQALPNQQLTGITGALPGGAALEIVDGVWVRITSEDRMGWYRDMTVFAGWTPEEYIFSLTVAVGDNIYPTTDHIIIPIVFNTPAGTAIPNALLPQNIPIPYGYTLDDLYGWTIHSPGNPIHGSYFIKLIDGVPTLYTDFDFGYRITLSPAHPITLRASFVRSDND